MREELQEVRQLWAQRLARQVGLPGLRLMQDEGARQVGNVCVCVCTACIADALIPVTLRQRERAWPSGKGVQRWWVCLIA